jgi:hypothetical protein
VADGGDFGLDGFGGAGGGLSFLDEFGEVAVHDAVHEVEVDDLPRDDVDGAGDEGDAEADREAPAEGDDAAGDVIAVGADAEEDKKRDEDDGGIAEDQPAVAVFEVFEEWERGDHQDRGENAGDEAEGEDGLLQWEAPVVDLKILCGAEAGFVVMLLGDFGRVVGEIMLWGDGFGAVYCCCSNSAVCESYFCWETGTFRTQHLRQQR